MPAIERAIACASRPAAFTTIPTAMPLLAVNTRPRLVEPCAIIDARVNDFAVARTDPGANTALAFDDDHFALGPSERP